VVPWTQTLGTSLIILVDLTILIVGDKLLLDIQLIHSFMPNLILKPWMVSTVKGHAKEVCKTCSFQLGALKLFTL
jgi:hypothetical protein